MATTALDILSREAGDVFDQYTTALVEEAYVVSGAGSAFRPYAVTTKQFDRWGYNASPINMERSGYTFFTRPRLNLVTENVRADSAMRALNSIEPNSPTFMLRALLDPVFASREKGAINIRKLSEQCPYFDVKSPFNKLLTNHLMNFSGGNDLVIDTFTSPPGLMNEEQTIAIGSDLGVRGSDLSLTFREGAGGVIFGMFYLWMRWIALGLRNSLVAYPDDTEEQRLSYTVSIYRYTMDPSLRFILGYQKFTGCFPKSLSIGSRFNVSHDQQEAPGAKEVTVTFQANVCEVMNAAIMRDFNYLSMWFNPSLGNKDTNTISPKAIELGHEAHDGYMGYPLVLNTPEKPSYLGWFYTPDEKSYDMDASYTTSLNSVHKDILKLQNSVSETVSSYLEADNLLDSILLDPNSYSGDISGVVDAGTDGINEGAVAALRAKAAEVASRKKDNSWKLNAVDGLLGIEN